MTVLFADIAGNWKFHLLMVCCPAERSAPCANSVEGAARLLAEARYPVMICGGGVVISHAEAELVQLAERLSAPVATTISGKCSIDEQHPLAVGVVGSNGGTLETRAIVDQADLIFFIGCRAGSVTTERWRHPAKATTKIIHLDVDPAVPGTNYPADAALAGDTSQRLVYIDIHEALYGRHAARFVAAHILINIIAKQEYQGVGETESEALENCLAKIQNIQIEDLFPSRSGKDI